MRTPEKASPSAVVEGQPLFASPEKRTIIICLLLVVATLAVYNRVNQNRFVNYDDLGYLQKNVHVRTGLHWNTVVWAFTSPYQANWHPLTWLSHALDCHIFRLNPAGHHYTNVLLHAVNVVLLFLLLQRATGFTWRSLMVAALFALHPINVESVAWASERKNVLSMLFFLLALAAYDRYARQSETKRYLLVVGLFALGLMAKPQVITLPFVLLLWDYWPLQRIGARPEEHPANEAAVDPLSSRPFSFLLLEKLPLLLLSAASAIVTLKAQSAAGAVKSELEYPLFVRLENAVVSYARYIGKAFWPSPLSAMYPHPGSTLPGWQVLGAVALLALITVVVILARRRRYLAVGWFWFLGTLVPMIGVMQVGVQAMADRYAYISFIGLFVMVCWGAAEWAEKRQLSAVWLAAPAVLALAVLSALTYRQIGYWHDSITLWSHALQVTSRNFVAHDNLGGALEVEGRPEEAIVQFRAAVQINPRDPLAHVDIGVYERQHGNPQKAIEEYQTAMRLTTDQGVHMNAHSNLGTVYRTLGDYARARENYEAALRLDSSSTVSLTGMGLLAQRDGDFAQAANYYSQAASAQPSDIGFVLLAQALEKSGRASEAQAAYQEAKRLSPDLSAARQEADRLLSH